LYKTLIATRFYFNYLLFKLY